MNEIGEMELNLFEIFDGDEKTGQKVKNHFRHAYINIIQKDLAKKKYELVE